MSNDKAIKKAGIRVTDLDRDDRVTRITFDLLCTNLQSIIAAHRQISSKLETVLDGVLKNQTLTTLTPESIRSMLFNEAWTIVDKVHNTKQLISIISGRADISVEIEGLLELCVTARAMRNKMDHVNQQIKNLAAMIDKPALPLLGIITATALHDGCFDQGSIRFYDTIVLSHSDFHHKLNFHPDANQAEIFHADRPIDNIKLRAFDQSLNLSKSAACAEKILESLSLQLSRPAGSDDRISIVLRANLGSPWLHKSTPQP